MNKEIFWSIKDILSNENKVYDADFRPESNLRSDLGLDSLDVVELLMELEKKYKIRIPDDELERVVTVQDVVNLVEQFINNK